MAIQFNRELEFEYGVVEHVAPGIRRVIAPNPSPFTFHGTGTYIIGQGDVAVVDPGPALQQHVDALIAATAGETITHLLVTHTHADHSPACKLLREHTDAPTHAFGPHGQGKIERGVVIEEGGDMEFTPDVAVRDGDVVEGANWRVECVFTPGHTSNHMCFAHRESNSLFCGDHVMAWSTSVISPPDGDMRDYIGSLDRLLARDDATYWPTHGPSIDDPKPFVRDYIDHRNQRARELIDLLNQGHRRIETMVPMAYPDIDPRLHAAAGRSMLATLVHLVELEKAGHDGVLGMQAEFFLIDR
jgi:glyoxylase-like metal-dependent hydrolase (beta-lactamase superfamily II)